MKNQIFELFGYPLDCHSKAAERCRKNCICPFTEQLCDGGGNRYQTFVSQSDLQKMGLTDYFSDALKTIPTGVCSLETHGKKWIVCPRRIFSFASKPNEHSQFVASLLNKYGIFEKGKPVGVWSEVKVKQAENTDGEEGKSFDYTFDYIAATLGIKSLAEIAQTLGITLESAQKQAEQNGYTVARRGNDLCVEDFPIGKLNIIEVMTSSTSGGNKSKGTTIQQSFLKAIQGEEHESPGINYRQVWARMVSQLIVKSQIGAAWGSKTLWILQDSLTDYISRSTDLNLEKLISSVSKEVNLVSIQYDSIKNKMGCLNLKERHLYAGEIPKVTSDTDFNKLLQAAFIPKMDEIACKLILKPMRKKILLEK
jgi:hypothetical protein